MLEQFTYRGHTIQIHVRAILRPGYSGLSTADIWYSISDPVSYVPNWTLMPQVELVVGFQAEDVRFAAEKAVRAHIDALIDALIDEREAP